MKVPSLADVFRIHDDVLRLYGGEPGVLNAGAIESALHRATWGPFFAPPDDADRCALLLRGLCQDHPFADGNKRTAFAATEFFLRINGKRVEAGVQRILDFMLATAQDQLDLEEIAAWLRDSIRND